MDNLQFNPDELNVSSSYITTEAATVSSPALTTASLNVSRWKLDDSIEGSVIATLVGIEFILSLLSNLFILTLSLLNRESLYKSSTIFLFNLSLSNLIVTLLYMDFYIISSGAEEWIFGRTDFVRNILCQCHGFAFALTTNVSLFTLAAISFDRFLYIVKPHLHRRFLTWKTALGIMVFLWLLTIILSLFPCFNLGLGEYGWSNSVGGCIPRWIGNRTYVIIVIILSTIPLAIIFITSAWTFVFTRAFLRQSLKRKEQTLDSENLKVQQHIYSDNVRNLIGIFGMLLLFNILTSSPFMIISIVGPVVGLDRVPHQIYVTIFVLFLFSNVTNPIIQVYFRRDFRDTIKKYFMRVTSILKRRETGEQAAMARRTDSSSQGSGVVIRKDGGVERGICEDLTVVEIGEGRSGIDSSRQGSCANSSSCELPLVILESTVTEEGSIAVSLDIEVNPNGGGRGRSVDQEDM